MFRKPITVTLVAALALFAGRGLSKTGERTAPPKAHRPPVATLPAPAPVVPATPPFDPSKAFVDFGCSGCHGDDGIYRDEIKGAIGKPVDQVARWIRNAPSIRPGTDMPSFETVIDESKSIALAGWVMDRATHLD